MKRSCNIRYIVDRTLVAPPPTQLQGRINRVDGCFVGRTHIQQPTGRPCNTSEICLLSLIRYMSDRDRATPQLIEQATQKLFDVVLTVEPIDKLRAQPLEAESSSPVRHVDRL